MALTKTNQMYYLKIWIHIVFSTKNREPYLTKEIRQKVHQHIIQNCKEKDREKYNDKKNCISEEVIDGHKICSACFKNYPEDHYIGNRNNITKTCKKCREDNKKQDEKY